MNIEQGEVVCIRSVSLDNIEPLTSFIEERILKELRVIHF